MRCGVTRFYGLLVPGSSRPSGVPVPETVGVLERVPAPNDSIEVFGLRQLQATRPSEMCFVGVGRSAGTYPPCAHVATPWDDADLRHPRPSAPARPTQSSITLQSDRDRGYRGSCGRARTDRRIKPNPVTLMKSQFQRRLKKLTATIGSRSKHEYTLEELCWEYWRRGQRDFMALANGDCTYLRVFVDSFKRKESGEGHRTRGHRSAGNGIGTRGRGAEGKLAR